MTQENKYSKVIKALKNNSPVLSDKEKLTDEIMKRIQKDPVKITIQERLDNFLFGWVDSFGLRLAMATVTVFLIGFFVVQQVVIQNRLNSLEKQLVKTVNTINGQESEPGMMQKVMLKMALREQLQEDSITVSVDDMDEFLNSYMELLEDYESIKRNFGPEQQTMKKLKKDLGNSENVDL
ncbi:MAG: hypothetical protein R3182_02075 [Draconibacterium sp.]|nr:hypothetical protein [Draconibacterium sp.]